MLPTKKTNTLMESLISLLSTSVTSQWSTNFLNNFLPSVVQHDTSEPWMDRRLSNVKYQFPPSVPPIALDQTLEAHIKVGTWAMLT